MTEIVLAGASAPELMAVSGHRSMAEAQTYIDEVFDLADTALGKLRTKRDGAVTNKGLPSDKQSANPLKKQGA
jgi:hypothetical protein